MKKILKTILIFSVLIGALSICSFPARAQFERNNDIYVDLAWTCNSYIPENYTGKALPVRGSSITVSAMPHFKINNQLADTDDLNYRWFLDDEIVSGNNKPEFSFSATKYRSYTHEVRVIVSTSDESVSSQEWINIKIYTPEIQIYEYDGSTQINLTRGIGEDLPTYAGSSLAFAAIPYYFNIDNLQELSYDWKLQGTQLINKFTELPQIIEMNIGTGLDYLEKTISLITSNKFNALETSIKNFILKINE